MIMNKMVDSKLHGPCTFPPEVDEVVVIAVIAVVVSEGMETIEFESFRQRTEPPTDLLSGSKPKLPLTT